MNECSAYVGLDVHKDTIAVAVALPGRGGAGVPRRGQESTQVGAEPPRVSRSGSIPSDAFSGPSGRQPSRRSGAPRV